MQRKPVLLVVSGPSGAGKDSLVDELRRLEPELAYSVSATTRARRPGEVDGVHYHFLNRENFQRRLSAGEFIESREYAGNFYGTPRRFVESALDSGRDIVMKPEVNGAAAIKTAYPETVMVFLRPPSASVLAERLERRSTENADAIAERLAIAHDEAERLAAYDYVVVNDVFDAALLQLHAILIAERTKVCRVL
ncbi:MAG: guanylate kinase [Candidatus Eremiobacteraeota bacterium]|nr:guanylate kinase [Candidatus Eremiobacteraeota bacterium]MBC5827908.1 guanylate kinase [Candidatus Eremiobacteraeota bacterium]